MLNGLNWFKQVPRVKFELTYLLNKSICVDLNLIQTY